MDTGVVMDIAVKALATALMISAPILGVSIIVGLAISIFQATTHIQEQTLTFVPKIIAILGMLILFGPWIMNLLTNYVTELYLSANNFIL